MGIVGAGPAGLTAALALAHHAPAGSVDVTVLDRNRTGDEQPGLEYGLQQRAMRALHRIGADGAARRRGQPVSRIDFQDDGRGRRQAAFRVPSRWTTGVLRREFLADLAAEVSAPVLRDHRVERLSAADGVVRVDVAGRGGREFDLLIAADGVRSLARSTWFPAEARTHDRGFCVVYVLADGRGVPDADLPPGFPAVADGHVVQFTRGSFATNTWFPAGGRRLTLALGVDEPTRARLFAEQGVAPSAAWGDLDGPTRLALARRIAGDTPGRGGLVPAALDLVRDWTSPDVYLWSMRDSDPLERPYAPDAPVVLIGDAAHAFIPTIGMGASLAIEDAEVLGRLVGRHLARGRRAPLHEDVLVPFGRARYPVWRDLVTRARAAVVNWRHDRAGQGFLVSPYVPSRTGAAVVRAYERLRGRTGG